MNRAETLRLHALHKAAATALEARLKSEAVGEYTDQGAAVTWRLTGGTVSTRLAHNRATETDHEALLDYLEEHTAAVQRIETRQVPDAFLETFLAEEVSPVVFEEDGSARPPERTELEPGATFYVVDRKGVVVPGVRYTVGGRISSIAIELERELKSTAAKAAAQYADGSLTAEEYFSIL
jgi:hypothetical protein